MHSEKLFEMCTVVKKIDLEVWNVGTDLIKSGQTKLVRNNKVKLGLEIQPLI